MPSDRMARLVDYRPCHSQGQGKLGLWSSGSTFHCYFFCQLHSNNFELYLNTLPLNENPQNLFTLRCDLHSPLLHQLLYARFAWALFKIVQDSDLPKDLFNFDEDTDDDDSVEKGPSSGKKRKRNETNEGDSHPSNPRNEEGLNQGGQSRMLDGNTCKNLLPLPFFAHVSHRWSSYRGRTPRK
jgi:hypothetical protein